MGQVISFIFGCLCGRKKTVQNEKSRPNHEDYAPLRSYYIDTVEDHDHNNKEAASAAEPSFHPYHHVVTISKQQQQQEAVSDSIVEVGLHQPLVATNSIVINTAGFEGTKELNARAAAEAATSSKRKGKNKKMKKNPKNQEAVRKIGPHNSKHKILLVGEGDFSFSASLAVAFANASNITATSLNDKDFLLKNYSKAMSNIMELENRGASVIHCVNATKMEDHELLGGMKFDRIIFNFPHSGCFADNATGLSQSQTLARGFLRNAKKMIKEDGGEIHVAHKTSRAFIKWNIVELASMEGLCLVKEHPFHPGTYPGYEPKFGFKGDKNFDCYPCKTYRFGLIVEV